MNNEDERLLADQAEAVVAEGLQEGLRSEVVLRFQVLDDNPEEEGGLVEGYWRYCCRCRSCCYCYMPERNTDEGEQGVLKRWRWRSS